MKRNGEDILREKLVSPEPEFQASDWHAMEELLDYNDSPVPPVSLTDSENQTPINHHSKKQIIMTILSVTTILGILLSPVTNFDAPTPKTNTAKYSAEHPIEKIESAESEIIDFKSESNTPTSNSANYPGDSNNDRNSSSFIESERSKNEESGLSTNEGVNSSTSFTNNETPPITNPVLAEGSDSTKKAINQSDTAEFYKVVTKRYWVGDRYQYVYRKPSGDIENFWFGMHYTQQHLPESELWDSIGRHKLTHGFNIQFMSGNVMKGNHIGFYAGLDWGMQFYGRSKKDVVLINSVNEDRGLTYIRSHTNDFLIRAHIEYARGPVVPYVNFGIGARIFSQGQTIKALMKSSEYESETDHSLMSKGSLLTSVGVGAKWRITPRMHFDVRYEQTAASQVDVINYATTEFDGTQYKIGKSQLNLSTPQIKFGLIFDFSFDEYDKILVEEGHYEVTTQELLLHKEDQDKIVIPCPCAPCKDKVTYDDEMPYRTHPFDSMEDDSDDGPIRRSGGGGSGRGKSEFPGLKKPPINH